MTILIDLLRFGKTTTTTILLFAIFKDVQAIVFSLDNNTPLLRLFWSFTLYDRE